MFFCCECHVLSLQIRAHSLYSSGMLKWRRIKNFVYLCRHVGTKGAPPHFFSLNKSTISNNKWIYNETKNKLWELGSRYNPAHQLRLCCCFSTVIFLLSVLLAQLLGCRHRRSFGTCCGRHCGFHAGVSPHLFL